MHPTNQFLGDPDGWYDDTSYAGTYDNDPVWNQYVASLSTIAPNLPAVVESSAKPGEDWLTTLQRIAPAVLGTWQQKQLMDIQVARARQGLPPIDMNAYTGLGVNVGLSQGTRNALLWGVGIAGAALVLSQMLKR